MSLFHVRDTNLAQPIPLSVLNISPPALFCTSRRYQVCILNVNTFFSWRKKSVTAFSTLQNRRTEAQKVCFSFFEIKPSCSHHCNCSYEFMGGCSCVMKYSNAHIKCRGLSWNRSFAENHPLSGNILVGVLTAE